MFSLSHAMHQNTKTQIFIATRRFPDFRRPCGGEFTVLLGDTCKTAIPVWEVKYKILWKIGLVKAIAKSVFDRKWTIRLRTKDLGNRHAKGDFHIRGIPVKGEINMKYELEPDNPLLSIFLGELCMQLYKDAAIRRKNLFGYTFISRNATAGYRLEWFGQTIATLKYPSLLILFEKVFWGRMHVGELTLGPQLIPMHTNRELFLHLYFAVIILYWISLSGIDDDLAEGS